MTFRDALGSSIHGFTTDEIDSFEDQLNNLGITIERKYFTLGSGLCFKFYIEYYPCNITINKIRKNNNRYIFSHTYNLYGSDSNIIYDGHNINDCLKTIEKFKKRVCE